MIYRYQELQHGLHNFNDHVLLSLELCLFLRQNLQNHVSVSRVINSLESLRRVNFPARDTILHGYCHFEALSEIDYEYSCVNCGYFPPVVIMDLHKKGVFSMAVSDIKDPSEEYNGEQNVEDFWDSVHLEMICRGFVPSGWSAILCPHSVAYSLKFNLRAESPRDFTDLLLSWKHLPNVSVYDFANLRAPSSLPFQPHEGRLAASTQGNIDAAQQRKLEVSLPWLNTKRLKPRPKWPSHYRIIKALLPV
ncbi:hypothetical protein SKAU_G00096680 [Synaphobranchus kaupii]|uniref:HMG domain-containing protein n=1 Tax=Synaphobranchus kaupii TaxID=118154 RepID=A0A9Q1FYN0_SYNKA|nr:hypothetical protein SKAU_G00096680 [Synaphobranchus kaupii]